MRKWIPGIIDGQLSTYLLLGGACHKEYQMKKVLVSILMLIFLVGCATPPPTPRPSTTPQDVGTVIYSNSWDTILRIVDSEAGVVCWVYNGYREGGISCLLLESTKLDGGM